VGAGDDQHGDGAHHGAVDLTQAPPGQEGDQPGGGGDVEQQRREPVGEHLGPAAAGLGLGHQTLDAGQRRVATHGVDRTRMAESVDTVPATVLSPAALATG
jgi:hypothetical protein